MRYTIISWITAALLIPSGRAEAVDVTVEISPGLSVPLGSFIDGYPVPVGEVNQALDSMNVTPGAFRMTLENEPGFAIRTSVLLNAFEIHYDLQRYTWGRIYADAFSLKAEGADFLEDVFFPFSLVGFDELDPGVDGDEVLEPLFVHRLVFGYRFFLLDGQWRPYIPAALGVAVVDWAHSDTLFGFVLEMGLGLDYGLTDVLTVGLDVRFSTNLFQNPALDLSDVTGQAVQGATGTSLFETVIEAQQLFLSQIHVGYKF